MKTTAVLVCLFAVQVLGQQIEVDFSKFLKTHKKNYKSKTELESRYSVWKQNMDFINKFNEEADLGLHTYHLKMNSYGDFNSSEFTSLVNGNNETLRLRYPVQYDQILRSQDPKTLPKQVDWRKANIVTTVKDQLNCGSCWAFAATGTLEGQLALKYRILFKLSDQQLVDCSSEAYEVYGCDGGFAELALAYIRDTGGMSLERNYPYKAIQQKQCFTGLRRLSININSILNVASGDEMALQTAVATVGPIAVAIDASSDAFQFYSTGVYLDKKCRSDMYSLNHAVLVVGYGTDPKNGDYWIVKNSWGTTWGEDGYVRMARNKKNNCGIASDAVYATID
jgi:C1A family cysteine protease